MGALFTQVGRERVLGGVPSEPVKRQNISHIPEFHVTERLKYTLMRLKELRGEIHPDMASAAHFSSVINGMITSIKVQTYGDPVMVL